MEEKYLLRGENTFHLAPFKYPWAYTMVQNSLSNHWHPQELSMGSDKACYERDLSADEKHLFENVFATLTTADLAIASNLTERLYEKIKAAEVKLYLGRQISEEILHSFSYQHIIEVIGLDQEETYTRYQRIPAIADWFALAKTEYENPNDLLLPMIFQFAIFEGVFFMTGFAAIYALHRIGKMSGTAQQIQYIHRDESMHIAFGIKLLNEIFHEMGEHPQVDEVFDLFDRSIAALDVWADYCVPTILGYNAALHKQHSRYLADRRLQQLGYPKLYGVAEALPWLDAQASIRKEKNFFESKVTEYQSAGALQWGDDD